MSVNHNKYEANDLLIPSVVLERLGMNPLKMNIQGYWILRCPFHKNGQERHPSFNLHSVTGHYLCHACGEKGGNIISFYMRMTSQTFSASIKALRGI